MDAKLLFIQSLSPLHAGTGQGVGIIDLPIAREKATQIPFLPGSSIKGVFRDACEDKSLRTRVFGPDARADLHAGSVTFTDARLLLLPVRSLRGVFSWVTSPLLLSRLARDIKSINELVTLPSVIPAVTDENCLIADQTSSLKAEINNQPQVVLEDLPLLAAASPDVTAWAKWLGETLFPQDLDMQKIFGAHICLVSDDALSFLLETATEITARIRIEDEKKTVSTGALWYEEALPAETVLVGLVVAGTVKSNPVEVMHTIQSLTEKILQFGGKATVGRGLCKTTLV